MGVLFEYKSPFSLDDLLVVPPLSWFIKVESIMGANANNNVGLKNPFATVVDLLA